jgi:protein-L-isoaspartate(D-aspartate) O-methyltransferase
MKPLTEGHLETVRRHMVEWVDIHYDLASEEIGKSTVGEQLRAALLKVPRHLFVPGQLAILAYQDTPLPLPFEKSVSQPFIGALMIDLLDVQAGNEVLEVGTGLGYQAALLAELAANVHSVEIIEEFAGEAGERLRSSGYNSVAIRVGDGSRGWAEHAPFDRILVTAAAKEPPSALVEQLKSGGKMVIPLGPKDSPQQLTLIEKDADDQIRSRAIMPVRFTELETMI